MEEPFQKQHLRNKYDLVRAERRQSVAARLLLVGNKEFDAHAIQCHYS